MVGSAPMWRHLIGQNTSPAFLFFAGAFWLARDLFPVDVMLTLCVERSDWLESQMT